MTWVKLYIEYGWFTIPATFAVADVIVKYTPWHGDDDIMAAAWKAYKKYFKKSQ